MLLLLLLRRRWHSRPCTGLKYVWQRLRRRRQRGGLNRLCWDPLHLGLHAGQLESAKEACMRLRRTAGTCPDQQGPGTFTFSPPLSASAGSCRGPSP